MPENCKFRCNLFPKGEEARWRIRRSGIEVSPPWFPVEPVTRH